MQPRCWTCNQEVPVWKKLAYAVGSMPYSMITTVLGFYFNIFLLEVVIVSDTRACMHALSPIRELHYSQPLLDLVGHLTWLGGLTCITS